MGLTLLEADRLSDANATRYLRVIDHVKPAILDGYVSSLVELSQIGRARGIDVQSPAQYVQRPKLCCLMSEYSCQTIFVRKSLTFMARVKSLV